MNILCSKLQMATCSDVRNVIMVQCAMLHLHICTSHCSKMNDFWHVGIENTVEAGQPVAGGMWEQFMEQWCC